MERQRTMRIQDALWNAGCSGRVAKADSVVLAGFDRRKRFLLALQQRFVVVVSVMHGLSRNRNYNDAFRLEIGGHLLPERQEDVIDNHETVARVICDAADLRRMQP